MKYAKIVLTGGPCAGKTTALSLVPNYFEKMGWHVLVLNEIATQVILSGFHPNDFDSVVDFEWLLMRMQVDREQNYETQIRLLSKSEKVLLICDRGLCDCEAYLDIDQYEELLQRLHTSPVGAMERYDAVFHLVTAADGAEEFYTLSNNAARLEQTIDEAIAADYKTQNAWVGHSHLRIIGNSGNFEDKMHELIAEISSFLGEPEPFEIERKYLIKRPDEDGLLQMPNCQKVDILQTYLTSNPGVEDRVRQRGCDGDYVFTRTTKSQTSDPTKRIEIEKRIDKDEYLRLLMQADPRLHPVRKTRFCILQRESGQYLEIDFYPQAQKYAILEVELQSSEDEVVIPDFIEVVREVTSESEYKNHSIAKNGGLLPE